MQKTARPGRLWPKEEDLPEWWDDPHPGMVVRAVKDGQRKQYRMPLDRTLEQAMAWAAKEFGNS